MPDAVFIAFGAELWNSSSNNTAMAISPTYLGMLGVVIGQSDTHDAALADAWSAAKFHLETFGDETPDQLPRSSGTA